MARKLTLALILWLVYTARHIQNFRVVKDCLGDISLQSQPFLRALVAWASILRIIDAYI